MLCCYVFRELIDKKSFRYWAGLSAVARLQQSHARALDIFYLIILYIYWSVRILLLPKLEVRGLFEVCVFMFRDVHFPPN